MKRSGGIVNFFFLKLKAYGILPIVFRSEIFESFQKSPSQNLFNLGISEAANGGVL